MKKFLIAILAVFATAAFAQEAFPDIPDGHWAGDAVERVADLGIVIGFPDGTFRGNESFTRYQMALVISRLLDVIQQNMDAALALRDADIASLRNALQELASDVAAQGVRLNAAEGGIASLSDDVLSNTARIDALEAAWAEHMAMGDMGGMSDEDMAALNNALADMQNQIDSARVTADTAAAQAAAAAAAADAAGAAAAGASDAAAAAGAQARQNAAAIDAINDLLALLNNDIEGIKNMMGDMEMPEMVMPEMDLSGIDRNASDIANIREFVILLRRDQVALRDRVAALEASDAAQAEQLADIEARLAQVEADLLVISGSITVTYKAFRLSGDQPLFDIDRVWGINNDRSISGSNFSSGTSDVNDDGDLDEGEVAQDRQDIETTEGEAEVDLELNVGFSATKGANGDPRALNSFDAVLKASLKKAVDLTDEDGDLFDGYVFSISDIKGTYDPIGAAPLTFQFGEDISANFTPYVFNADDDGFVATLGSPDFLAFLSPTLTVAYGERDDDLNDDAPDVGDLVSDDYPDTYYRGVRGTLTPLSGDTFSATGGFSFAEVTSSAGENANALDDNQTATVWGVDGSIGVSILDIDFEFANESGYIDSVTDGRKGVDQDDTTADDDSRSLIWVKAGVDVKSIGIPLINSLSANYRSIPAAWFGVFADSDDYPYSLDQTGFGVNAELGLFILDPLSFYFDSYTNHAGANPVTAFGADATINLFSAFAITGFYHSASIDGNAVDDVESGVIEDETAPITDMDRETNYDTAFGVRLEHDGSADNALIGGLNLSAEYKQSEADFSKTTIDVNADTTLGLSIVELTPYVGFKSVNDTDTGSDNTTTIKAGTGIKTEPLDIFLSPSLEASVNYRSTSHSAPEFTASELQYGVGLNLGQFLFDNSDLRVKYGSWTGTNVTNETNSLGSGDNATDISDGDADGTGTQTTTGYEVVWNYYDLIFAYGAYTNDNDGVTGAAQAFKITYKVTF